MNFLNNAFVLSVSIVGLAGCGGSSDGGTAPGGGNNIFTNFSNIPDNGTTNLEGTSRSASYEADDAGLITRLFNLSGPDDASATLVTKNGDASAIGIKAPGANVSFDSENGDTFEDYGVLIGVFSANGQDTLTILDSESAGFEYQTFGAWLTGLGTSSGGVGVGSFGARTASGSLPSGTATYDGFSSGFLRESDGTPFVITSEVTVTTDFSTATITSASTTGFSIITAAEIPKPNIDFTGEGPVSGSGFTASVAGPSVSGSADGQFYGPNAQEVGGTFGLAGSGIDYIGSFGAKQ